MSTASIPTLALHPRLYVEGKDDENVITQLLMRHGIFAHAEHGRKLRPADCERVEIVVEWMSPDIDDPGSKSALLDGLAQAIKTPKPRALGFVIDADDPAFTLWSLVQTWAAVRHRLATSPASIAASESIGPDGFVGRHSQTRTPIGVWLMPDNQRDGALEDFLQSLLPPEDGLMIHASDCTKVAHAVHGAKFAQKDFKKAELHAWLAWQEQPGLPYGTALNKHWFQHDTDIALRFVNWVKRLIQDVDG